MKKIKKLLKSIFKKKTSDDEFGDYTDIQIQDHTQLKKIKNDDEFFYDDIDETQKTSLFGKIFKSKSKLPIERDDQTIAGKFETVILRGARKPEQRSFFSRLMIYLLVLLGLGVLFETSGGWQYFSTLMQSDSESDEQVADEQSGLIDEVDLEDKVVTKPKNRKAFIDFKKKGPGLVYNCRGGHWACVERRSYVKCQKAAAVKPPACRALRFFKSTEQCQVIQQSQIDKGLKVNFCD